MPKETSKKPCKQCRKWQIFEWGGQTWSCTVCGWSVPVDTVTSGLDEPVERTESREIRIAESQQRNREEAKKRERVAELHGVLHGLFLIVFYLALGVGIYIIATPENQSKPIQDLVSLVYRYENTFFDEIGYTATLVYIPNAESYEVKLSSPNGNIWQKYIFVKENRFTYRNLDTNNEMLMKLNGILGSKITIISGDSVKTYSRR